MNTLYNRNDNAALHQQQHAHAHAHPTTHHPNHHHQQRSNSFSTLRPHMSRLPLDGRVRGDDGRFISRTEMINPVYNHHHRYQQQHQHNPTYHRTTVTSNSNSNSPNTLVPGSLKVCGWCGRTSTSQWRVGPTNGSLGMF